MAYLGKSPSQGVRNRYYFTASGGETSISGALTGGTLTFSDGAYVDVMLNGVTLVAGTDYNTTTANTIAGLTALSASDIVEIVVYDVFSVFSGNVNSDFSIGEDLTVSGNAGIGTASPTRALQVESTAIPFRVVSSDSNGNIEIGDSTGSVRFGSGSSGAMRFFVGGAADFSGEAEKVRIDSDGLKFNGDTAAVNGLDDYEEGTWTPTGAASSGTAPSFASASGSYTRIGRLVTVNATVTNITAGGTSSAQVQVASLPFTPDTADAFGALSYSLIRVGADDVGATVLADASANVLIFMMNRNDLGRTGIDNQHLQSGTSDLYFTVSYITNQ